MVRLFTMWVSSPASVAGSVTPSCFEGTLIKKALWLLCVMWVGEYLPPFSLMTLSWSLRESSRVSMAPCRSLVAFSQVEPSGVTPSFCVSATQITSISSPEVVSCTYWYS